ncbi:MAG: hypothetical protein MUC38_00190 [Cyclobacteriaceae bacterium]|jgi:hypothetical protein|nr:hypothetical protein [Cyclobacteriaceae bacterium]
MINRATLVVLMGLATGGLGSAQVRLIPIPASAASQAHAKARAAARTQTLPAKNLPFWDDFSFAVNGKAQDSLWNKNAAVAISQEIGINPLTLGVATFDGYGANGRPYVLNDINARGYADTLLSRELRMDLVPLADRGQTFLSFFYQAQGEGEAPDRRDRLELWFKKADGTWEEVWEMENSELLDPTVFYQVVLPITLNDYFHEGFQFLFQNFGRRSGPYDTWNLDYVFLDWDRGFARGPGRVFFPDRAITHVPSPLFGQYRSMPYAHFLQDPEANLSRVAFPLYNACNNNMQPIAYYTFTQYTHFSSAAATEGARVMLDNRVNSGNLNGLDRTTLTVASRPAANSFDPQWDSVYVNFMATLESGDESTAPTNLDCAVREFPGIDFRWNDTTRTRYTLSDFYAYDDGTAEYGAGLNSVNAQMAYRFDLSVPGPQQLEYIDLYFPRFGDESSQVIQIKVMSDLSGTEGNVLYSANVPLRRSELNRFWRFRLDQDVSVQGSFFIGWKQSVVNVIAIGLDNSHDTRDRIYYNTNGTWRQDIDFGGSLMIRPGFGDGGGPITGIENEPLPAAYPNPSSGYFYLPAEAQAIEVFSVMGQPVSFLASRESERTRVELTSPRPACYVIRYRHGTREYHQRLMVR